MTEQVDPKKAEEYERRRQFLNGLYATRPCAICKKRTWCAHREPMVDLAAFGARRGEQRYSKEG